MVVLEIFPIFAPNIDHRCLLASPHWGDSDEYPSSEFLSPNKEDIILTIISYNSPVNYTFTCIN